MHLQQGGIKTHNNAHHHEDRLTRTDITNNITILQHEQNRRKLHILEAVYIRKLEPAINRQVNARGVLRRPAMKRTRQNVFLNLYIICFVQRHFPFIVSHTSKM